jgi:hypothetical protein
VGGGLAPHLSLLKEFEMEVDAQTQIGANLDRWIKDERAKDDEELLLTKFGLDLDADFANQAKTDFRPVAAYFRGEK